MTSGRGLASLIFGLLLSVVWLYRLIENLVGMRHVADIGRRGFEAGPDSKLPSLRVVVPARNEEQSIEQCLRSLLTVDYLNFEIVAIDDRSTDRTGSIMDRLAASIPAGRLHVIHVEELPAGWLGKTHAMWLGAKQLGAKQEGAPEWLLFTDGDVVFHPQSLRRAVAYAEDRRADHFALFPTVIMQTFGERMMISFFQTMFTLGYRPWRVSDPDARDFIGVGAFNLIRTEVYEKVGSYEALRLAVLDDLQLGEAVKHHGFAQRVAFGTDLVKLRWAKGAFGIVRNLTKNVFALLQFRVWLAFVVVIAVAAVCLGPFVGLVLAPGIARIGYGIAVASIAGLYASMGRFCGVSPLYAATYPIGTVLFLFTVVRSTALAVCRGGIVWRGTQYPLRELREHLGTTATARNRRPEPDAHATSDR